jgi:hypothetical protein
VFIDLAEAVPTLAERDAASEHVLARPAGTRAVGEATRAGAEPGPPVPSRRAFGE